MSILLDPSDVAELTRRKTKSGQVAQLRSAGLLFGGVFRCVATGRWGIEWVPQNQPMTWMFDCLAQRLDGTIASHTRKDPVNSAINR